MTLRSLFLLSLQFVFFLESGIADFSPNWRMCSYSLMWLDNFANSVLLRKMWHVKSVLVWEVALCPCYTQEKAEFGLKPAAFVSSVAITMGHVFIKAPPPTHYGSQFAGLLEKLPPWWHGGRSWIFEEGLCMHLHAHAAGAYPLQTLGMMAPGPSVQGLRSPSPGRTVKRAWASSCFDATMSSHTNRVPNHTKEKYSSVELLFKVVLCGLKSQLASCLVVGLFVPLF